MLEIFNPFKPAKPGPWNSIHGKKDIAAAIKKLFANNEQGVWYDPSDMSTMFQDAAGTIPVTAAGQPVGLILDKSKGLVLGPELVTNGDFSAGSTGWSTDGGWAVNSGTFEQQGAAGYYSCWQDSITTVAGTLYKMTGTLVAAAGGLIIRPNKFSITNQITITVSGNFTCYFYGTGNSFGLMSNNTTGCKIDNISLKSIAGNHATQGTAAKCPLLQTSGGLWYLQFDGVDDSFITGSIDFTTVNKLSLFYGLRKNTDLPSILTELSSNISSTAGTFYAVSGDDIGYVYSSLSRGTAAGAHDQVAGKSSPIAPSTDVLTFTHSIPDNLSTIRVSGIPGTNGTGSKGTGNFANQPLFIGSRDNNSLFFAGNIYQIIILGRATTGTEINNTENYIAAKSGVTLP